MSTDHPMTNPDPQHGAAPTPQEQIAWQAIAQRISERTAYCEAEEAFPRLLAALTQAEEARVALGESARVQVAALRAERDAARDEAAGWRRRWDAVVEERARLVEDTSIAVTVFEGMARPGLTVTDELATLLTQLVANMRHNIGIQQFLQGLNTWQSENPPQPPPTEDR